MIANDLILESFISKHPMDVIHTLERLDIKQVATYLSELPIELATQLFLHIDRTIGSECLEIMDTDKSASIVEKLPAANALIFLRIVSDQSRNAIIDKLPEKFAQQLKRSLSYPEKSVAAHMDTTITVLPDDLTIEEALTNLNKQNAQRSAYIFIVNRDQHFKGLLPIQELVFASPKKKIASIDYTKIEPIPALANIIDILKIESWQNYCSLPVIDQSGFLLGALHYETIIKSEKKKSKAYLSNEALSTGKALGDLYRVALIALLRGATEPVKHAEPKIK